MGNIKHLLGKRIKEIRKRRGFTQEKLAELAGIEIPSLSNIENLNNSHMIKAKTMTHWKNFRKLFQSRRMNFICLIITNPQMSS